MKGDGFSTRFGFGISEVISNTGATDIYLHQFKVYVCPCQCDQFGSSQAGTAGKHHHCSFSDFQDGDERSYFCWREHVGFPQPLGRNSDFRDRVSFHPFMPDGMIENRRHDVTNLASCTWCKLQRMQPQFHVHGADIMQVHRSPFGNDVIRKIESVCFNSGVGFLLFDQLVFCGSGLRVQKRSLGPRTRN